MSKNFRLIDDGYPTFKKIVTGKKWIGRVCRRAGGDYIGLIGHTTFVAPTEAEAFDEVVARHLGYANAAGLRGHNAKILQKRRAAKAETQELVERFRSGDINEKIRVIDSVFDRMKRDMGKC